MDPRGFILPPLSVPIANAALLQVEDVEMVKHLRMGAEDLTAMWGKFDRHRAVAGLVQPYAGPNRGK
jgi:hypothetical protein